MQKILALMIAALAVMTIPCMGISVSVSGSSDGVSHTITSTMTNGALHSETDIGLNGINTYIDAAWTSGNILAETNDQKVGVSGTNTPMSMNIQMTGTDLVGPISTTDEVIHYFDDGWEYWEYWGPGSFTGGPNYPARQHHRTDAWNHETGEAYSVIYD